MCSGATVAEISGPARNTVIEAVDLPDASPHKTLVILLKTLPNGKADTVNVSSTCDNTAASRAAYRIGNQGAHAKISGAAEYHENRRDPLSLTSEGEFSEIPRAQSRYLWF